MFWRLGFAQTSPVEQLLENADVTLKELLDEEDLIQECKQLNKKLIDFLSVPEKIDEMLNYVVNEPPEDADDKIRYLYPYKASEVLSADLGPVYDSLFASETLTNKLFSFLDKEAGELNVMAAGLLCKVLTALLASRPQQTLTLLDERKTVPKLLLHIGTSSVLDLLLKVVVEAQEAVGEGNWIAWLVDQDLTSQLIAKLSGPLPAEVHENAATALVGLLARKQVSQWAAAAPPTPPHLTKQLLRPQTVQALLSATLSEETTPSALEHGLTVVVELSKHCLRVATGTQDSFSAAPSAASFVRGARSFGFEDEMETQPDAKDLQAEMEQEGIRSESVPRAIEEVLKGVERMVGVLRNPPPIQPIVNQAGSLDPPLGSTRLKVLEVLQALVGLEYASVDRELVAKKVIPATLDVFFRYEWHNLMHNLVQKMLQTVLNKQDDGGLKEALLGEGRLLERIVEAYEANEAWLTLPKRCRRGNMGHIRVLSCSVMRAAQNSAYVRKCTQSEAWQRFIALPHDLLSDLNEKSFSRSADAGHLSPFGAAPSSGDFLGAVSYSDDQTDDAEPSESLDVLGEAPSNADRTPEDMGDNVLTGIEEDDDDDVILATPADTPDAAVEDLTVGMGNLKVSAPTDPPTPSTPILAKVNLSVEMIEGRPSVRVTVTPSSPDPLPPSLPPSL
eukprot:CAMPEP_0177725400 /NCGR_PEP_ID=MMETSP0484_2-20121128/19230_1 /TAXON_ID=354590 /ORGANISM="Rhodomonas lens, Strain RHODO" /LENGTH=674 /DNA_ID=CAMNT_0019237909 /DNA_START=137 /DNA_END=2158 /DNA_ORIENTATION=-